MVRRRRFVGGEISVDGKNELQHLMIVHKEIVNSFFLGWICQARPSLAERMEHLSQKVFDWSQRQKKAAEDALYETHGAVSISIILVSVIIFVGLVKFLRDSLRRCLM